MQVIFAQIVFKQIVVGAIVGRFLALVTGQTNYATHVHSIAAGTGPRFCFVRCGPPKIMSLAALVWLIAGTCLAILAMGQLMK